MGTRTDDGRTELLVRFSTPAGSKKVSVGPFKWTTVPVGGTVEVVCDPEGLGNVLTPDEITSGRTTLLSTVGSALLLALRVLVIVVDALG
ncbi:hypothetical protein QQY24_14745 [Streptomyces sp. TG1A-8]|uniref:hypothetical protein n=1 Tax=Streptomyces sp. TG1A-8 TaxID=3051385 RepID=UPI00265C2CC6|nr:hypothetical protein [Streptomyces sp. TG1A-8]MDO0926609.1 hypothetical protein [Streptomyces sp. TG1A-8]